MSCRRMACLLLGLWLGAGLLMAWVATQDLGSADRLAAHPDLAAAVQLKSLGANQTLPLLRYLAAEQTRNNLETWGTVQLLDRKNTRLNSSHLGISYAVFCLK